MNDEATTPRASVDAEANRSAWLTDRLAHWREAGIIDADQVRGIFDFEQALAAEAGSEPVGVPPYGSASPAGARSAGENRPGVLEAVGYLGLAVVAVGVITLTAQHWDDLRTWARIAALAVPALLALAAGAGLHTSPPAEARRAAGVAWLAAVALLGGTIGVTGAEAEWRGENTLLLAGAATALLALILWVLHPEHPQIVALAGSLALLAENAAARDSGVAAGMLLMAFGAVGIALTERGLLVPRSSARLFAAIGFVVGPFQAGHLTSGRDNEGLWAQLLVIVAGLLLVALSLRRASFAYMAIAVAGIFLGLVTFIFRHFEDQIGAPLALILSGALLVAGAMLLATVRPRFRAGRPA